MSATERNPGGGVIGFAIAFIAFAFGGALGLSPLVELLVIAVGVVLAVLSAGMRGLGLAALVLGGIVLVSSLSLLGALGAARDLDEVPPPVSPTGTAPPPHEDGGYMLTPRDKRWIEASWGRKPEALQQSACASIRDGISDAELQTAARQLEEIPRSGPAKGIPIEETEALAFLRAGWAYTETELLLRSRGFSSEKRDRCSVTDVAILQRLLSVGSSQERLEFLG